MYGGHRITTDQPEKYDVSVHMFGPSYLYGFGVEDKYTIASCFQRLLNENHKNMLVMNYGIRGMRPEHYLRKIKKVNIGDKDLCIMYLPSNKKIKELFMYYQIPFIDMNYYFQEPRSQEMFFDGSSHMNYLGNQYIAKCLYNITSNQYKLGLMNVNSDEYEMHAFDERLNKSLQKLLLQKEDLEEQSVVGSIVMNCNPFTLGHYHLINIASQIVDFLYVFIVEEDKSEFHFTERIELVRKGISNLKNVKVLSSGEFIISSITFPEYFDKDEKQSLKLDLSKDVNIFGKYIVPAFNIDIRFVGEERTDAVTRQYNETMKKLLPTYGVKLMEIPRIKYNGKYISASIVRHLYHQERFDELRMYVPDVTYEFLKEDFAKKQSGIS